MWSENKTQFPRYLQKSTWTLQFGQFVTLPTRPILFIFDSCSTKGLISRCFSSERVENFQATARRAEVRFGIYPGSALSLKIRGTPSPLAITRSDRHISISGVYHANALETHVKIDVTLYVTLVKTKNKILKYHVAKYIFKFRFCFLFLFKKPNILSF